MSGPAAVSRCKRALVVIRRADDPAAAGVAVAIEAAGRALLLADSDQARGIEDGSLALVGRSTPKLLAVDDENHLALLELPDGTPLQAVQRLAVAPLPDGEELLVTGAGATVAVGDGQTRHLWITRRVVVAGRLHAFVDGQKQDEFGYLVDLPAGTLPTGSPLYRTGDAGIAALLSEVPGPGPGLVVARPVREAVALAETLPPPSEGGDDEG